MDRLLAETRGGTFYLRQPVIADMVVGALHYNAEILEHYRLHAFVIMPNHVHLLATGGHCIAHSNEIVGRHHRQARQRDAGFDGQTLLAGREL